MYDRVLVCQSIAVAAAGLVVGWANLHTDEVTVVVAIEIGVSLVCGAVAPRSGWVAGLLIGACVPMSQYLALLCGWHTPYPNTLRSIQQSLIAVPPAMLFGWVGGLVRRAIG